MTDAAQRLTNALAVHQHTKGIVGYCYKGHGEDAGNEARAILAADPTLADDLALGQAWREAVEALPEGVALRLESGHPENRYYADLWIRYAGDPDGELAPTPTAALQALTKQLRGEK